MFTVILLMLAGILTGYSIKKKIPFIGKAITVLIWVLLYILGTEVGSNKQITEGITSLGLDAAIITVFAVIGSCIAAWALWYTLYKNKKERKI